MNERELRRLSRADLLEILVRQGERIQTLESELAQARAGLENREIKLREVGSIAEASLRLNDVFNAAEKAAKQYLDNVKAVSDRQEEALAKREADSKAQAAKIILDAKREAEMIISAAKRRAKQ
ncbi:MAG: hypothetical protein IJ072_07070 [Oscillospiraceae bacterium]|nr:hypothetical protein [Oscillospiraceae bacterium]